ncbi:MAG: carboxypeptidase-like regulatory domain-containing protein, partial [Bacteroidales bacterium]|nr:carboxypeptidase-like regulatory domain-containing protein [Bacteroidales bacterium]
MEKIKSLLLGALFIIVSTTLQAQSFEATGVVVDNFGDAVIGATVMQKGTSNGTVTDIDGNFKINVNNGDILSVSYIGYVTQEFPAAKDMRIVLKEDAQSLQEVVVTGYQVQRKVDLTGAV